MAALVANILVEARNGTHPDSHFTHVFLGNVKSAEEAREKAVNYLMGMKYASAEVSVKGFGDGSGTTYLLTPTATL